MNYLYCWRSLCDIPKIKDQRKPSVLFEVFIKVYHLLKSQGILKQFEVLGGQLLIQLDGTEYFSSKCIYCEHCSHHNHKSGTVTYFHTAILPVIVSPVWVTIYIIVTSKF